MTTRIIQLIILSLLISQTAPAAEENHKKNPTEQQSTSEFKEEILETKGTVTIGNTAIPYKANVGTIIIKDGNNKPKAKIFYISYTKEDESNRSQRPITFCFNGGPGSSSVWLHMGAFGPYRINMTQDGQAAPPFDFGPNPDSILDLTDLVFIDPVSTGYSKPAPGEDAKQFHGVDEDVKAVAEFIRIYITRNDRWESPKFLAGESYGTTRAVELAGYLHEEHFMATKGIVLISSVLNFRTLSSFKKGNDLPFPLYLPTYAATAWYHQRLSDEYQKKELRTFLKEVEDFSANEYVSALFKGDSLPQNTRNAIAEKISAYTGIETSYVQQANLRINIFRFAKELLRKDNRTVGRFDSRFKGIDADSCGQSFEYDPSQEVVFPGFTSGFNHYLRSKLNWKSDEKYEILQNLSPWSYGKSSGDCLYVGETLRETMTKNPNLFVFVASGFYDLATPYYGTIYTFNHLNLEPSLRDHVIMRDYEAGHMMFNHLPSLVKLKNDLTEFYKTALQLNRPLSHD